MLYLFLFLLSKHIELFDSGPPPPNIESSSVHLPSLVISSTGEKRASTEIKEKVCSRLLQSQLCTCRKNRNNQGQCYSRSSVILTKAMFTLIGRMANHSRESLISGEFQWKSRLGDKHRLQKATRSSQTSSGVARMQMLCGHNMVPRLNFSWQFFSRYYMLARGMGRMPLKILHCLNLTTLAY